MAEIENEFNRTGQIRRPSLNQADDIPVVEAAQRWLDHLLHYPQPSGDLLPDGTLAGHYRCAVRFMVPLIDLFGDIWKLFGWLERQDLTPRGTVQYLCTVPKLRHIPKESKTVETEDWQAVLSYVSPVIGAMIQIQQYTAARPKELFGMRPMDIDRSNPDMWIYTPPHWKSSWRGKERKIPIAPACQHFIAMFLERAEDAYCFSPKESYDWWLSQRAKRASNRNTPAYPSELRRREKQRHARANSSARWAEVFTRHTYLQAVKWGIAKARKNGHRVADWTP